VEKERGRNQRGLERKGMKEEKEWGMTQECLKERG
jgi:hypothetical protein